MDLIGFVTSGQNIHHQIKAEPKGNLSLSLASRDHGQQGRAGCLVDRPCTCPVMTTGNDGRDAVMHVGPTPFNPNGPPRPAAREIRQQIVCTPEEMLRGDRDQSG